MGLQLILVQYPKAVTIGTLAKKKGDGAAASKQADVKGIQLLKGGFKKGRAEQRYVQRVFATHV